jgi:Zn-dependent protease with chaperone function
MQLAILLVIVCSISGSSSASFEPSEIAWRVLLGGLCLAVAPLTVAILRWRLAGLRPAGSLDEQPVHQRLEPWPGRIGWLWAASSLVVLYGAKWPQFVRGIEWTTLWPLADDVLILAPLLVSLLLTWALWHRCLAALEPEDTPSLGEFLAGQIRRQWGLTLLPALVILGVQESAVILGLTTGPDDARAWWLWGGLLAAALLALPLWLRCLWQTHRVADSPLKARLLASCRQLGCPVRDIVVWNTRGAVANAAVTGMLPRLRTIFLSDALIARLSDDELDVVVRHEAAHLARWHLWQRMALVALPVAAYLAVQAQFPGVVSAAQAELADLGIGAAWQISLLMPIAVLMYVAVAVGGLSRLHEHDADLAACMAGMQGIDPAAVGHLEAALSKIIGPASEQRRRRWLHPSPSDRVAFLKRSLERPQTSVRFRSRILSLSLVIGGTCLIALAAACWPLA